MVIDQYRFWSEWSEEDGEWVGLCDGFPLLSWLEVRSGCGRGGYPGCSRRGHRTSSS